MGNNLYFQYFIGIWIFLMICCSGWYLVPKFYVMVGLVNTGLDWGKKKWWAGLLSLLFLIFKCSYVCMYVSPGIQLLDQSLGWPPWNFILLGFIEFHLSLRMPDVVLYGWSESTGGTSVCLIYWFDVNTYNESPSLHHYQSLTDLKSVIDLNYIW